MSPKLRPASPPARRRSLSRTASRALDILEFVGEVGRPFRAVEIVRQLELHPATVNQLLKTLVASSHLIFDAQRKTYVPSPRLTGFSAWMTRNYGSPEQLHAMLTEVQAATGGDVTLTTGNDLFMQIIDAADERSSQGRRGMKVSLFGTAAIGGAYLSQLSDVQIERLIVRARVPQVETPAILAKVSRIRNEGFASGAIADGSFYSIAIPLPPDKVPVPLVLGIADVTERIVGSQTEFRGIMHDAVARWSAQAA